jgi:hypothetical protein
MVKAYKHQEPEDRRAYVEIATRLQRMDGVFLDCTENDRDWLMAKLGQGKLFRNDQTIFEKIAKPADRRIMGVLKSFGVDVPSFGLSFFFDDELDRYCAVEKLARITNSPFITALTDLQDHEVAARLEQKAFLDDQFYRLQAELTTRGPLMVSLSLPGSGISHAHVITGVLKTDATHQLPNRFCVMEYSAGEKSMKAPEGYWVAINDPSGSGAAIYDLQFGRASQRDKDERPNVVAESYFVPLSVFMLQYCIDYGQNQDSTKTGNYGKVCSPPSLVYAPDNADRSHTLPLPDACTDRNKRF